MQRLDSITGELLFGLISLVALAAPWLFGAWETWWFWPFIVGISAAGACFSLRLILSVRLGARRLNLSTVAQSIAVAWAPLLVYALIRAIQTDVKMDAERSFLLQFTPFLLGTMVALGLSPSRQRALIVIILVNFTLLAAYGITNHYLAGNAYVLWVPGFPQYQEGYHRLTGSYFCPDHFAGLMELPLALSLSLALVRSTPSAARIAAFVLSGVSLWAIILTRSRGGGIVACMVIMASVWLCTMSWPQKHRRYLRVAGFTGFTLAIVIFAVFEGHYVKRFKDYPWSQLEHSDRYQMSAGALRGWQSAPWFGVGPGMHPNLWPHFASSRDGNRLTGQWPTTLNTNFHSFEAHDDWAQFLEEYGVAGLLLFLIAAGYALWSLFRRWKRWAYIQSGMPRSEPAYEWMLPGLLLVALALGVHSFGDFNLQIPATTWLLGILTGLAVAVARHTPPFPSKRAMTRANTGDKFPR